MTDAGGGQSFGGQSFGSRLQQVFRARGQLCVGIDPHAALLSEWGLPDSATGARDFGLRVVDAAAGRAGIVKPQIAFFERHGSAGYAALEEVLIAARAAELVVIADVKRGDVGSTVAAYGEAWLHPGSSLEVDAMTVVAYQGSGSLDEVVSLAARHGKGLFVLAATSNPESFELQRSRRTDGRTVAEALVDDVAAWNADSSAPDELGSFGVVVGATIDASDFGLSSTSFHGMPILAPGFGYQGAQIAQLDALFGSCAPQVLVSASRSILSAGPEGLAFAIDAHLQELTAWHG